MIPKCSECDFCKMTTRANAKFNKSGIYGRGEFFCENPETEKLPKKAFGNKMEGFIGFGTPERESKLTLKTSPRWCPKRRLDGRSEPSVWSPGSCMIRNRGENDD